MKQTLLTAAMLLCCLSVSAERVEIEGIWYDLSSGAKTATVTAGNDYSGSIIIPSTVTHEGVDYSVKTIGSWAFRDCSSLTSITIPESVATIWYYIFEGCDSLTSIVVAEGNTVYDSREGCNAIIETNSNTLLEGCSTTIIPESVTSIGATAFYERTTLTSISIPEGVTSIGNGAFQGCSNLASVIVSEQSKLTNIGNFAFCQCGSLASITIPEGVTRIGDAAFDFCWPKVINYSNLSANSIAKNAVLVIKGSELTTVGDFQFSASDGTHYLMNYIGKDTDIVLPDDYNGTNYDIGTFAFYGCSGLTSITIPEGVTSIGDWAFSRCSSLTSFTSEAVTPPAIEGSYTFDGVDKSISVYVPVSSVEAYQEAEGWKEFANIVGVETAIEHSEIKTQESEITYDLHGRRVENPTKGIYILNGRKVVIND